MFAAGSNPLLDRPRLVGRCDGEEKVPVLQTDFDAIWGLVESLCSHPRYSITNVLLLQLLSGILLSLTHMSFCAEMCPATEVGHRRLDQLEKPESAGPRDCPGANLWIKKFERLVSHLLLTVLLVAMTTPVTAFSGGLYQTQGTKSLPPNQLIVCSQFV